ncbi:exopolysaccharide/PEP-CTERM locus tyrosine autokinase [Paucimonas lemoignei]|uniref:non-specific protein-tyrosine kinase n=1 Tax=Paucimonas lemoignei TaxID=29443 RepID=A0A4R3I0R8_PAULE|nr:XrtA-associated tyrosine autokinase [Paucimonas lemoignei]TCS38573.1 exopolysaccharide/PEP-CTERM locus tyrosine autokinase [Paucimonas lemoignei]
MSIIEKAIGKLERGRKETPQAPAMPRAPEEVPAPASASPIVEQAMAIAAPVTKEASIPQSAPPTQVSSDSSRRSRRIDINLTRLHELGMVTPDGGRTPIAEEFRLIKRPLIDKAFNQAASGANNHGNLVMVTSSLPGEGKTFCAVNLAISIAMEMDHTVLLVDADVARPSVPQFLGLKNEAGLMDILLDDKLDLADVMLKTNIDSLSFLPAGRSHRHATELLASQNMSRLLDEIARRYPDRIVIFDSPPVLLTTESRVLASQMGQIVVVVEAQKTTQHAVKSVLRQLGSSANVSLLYNKSRGFTGEEYYGRYYN